MLGTSQFSIGKFGLGALLCELRQTHQLLCAMYHSEGDIMKDLEEVTMEKKQDIQSELSNATIITTGP